MRQLGRRVAVPRQMQEQYSPKTLVAPVLGWHAADNVMTMPEESAFLSDNWFPTQSGMRVRKGARRHARVSADAAATSAFAYVSGSIKKMFVATEGEIFDVTTVDDNDVPPDPVVEGQGAGYYSTTQLETDGGDFLYAVNGEDDAQLFDGSTWQAMNSGSTPPLNNSANLSTVWKYRNRLFFTRRNSMTLGYIQEVNSIGGTLADFPLSGVCQRGGFALFGDTWSLVDVGNGMDDRLFVVTTEGEVVVYEGNNPSDPDFWRLIGRYDISQPLGPRAYTRVGADVLIATVTGIVSLAQIVNTDEIRLDLVSASAAIDVEWKREATRRRHLYWEMVKWTEQGMAIVSLPSFPNEVPKCFVANLKTGAWTRFVGWDTRCLVVHNGQVYFGTSDGRVLQAEVGGYDDDQLYSCSLVFAFNHFDAPAHFKTLHMARGVFLANHDFDALITASGDYVLDLATPPNAVAIPTLSGTWDTALWDNDVWDQAEDAASAHNEWQSIGISGFALALQVQVTVGSIASPNIELVAIHALYEPGEIPV